LKPNLKAKPLLNIANPQAIPTAASAYTPISAWAGSPRAIRELILKESFRANVGHIGSALSVVEILAALYSQIMRIESINDIDRDRFILAKGHAALALYIALYFRGILSAKQLSTFCGNDTVLGVHPEPGTPGVDFGTGSLGQGLSYAAGAALAARWQKSKRRVFVLISDAECNEGSTWEAVMFAGHHKLSNLCAIVDLNQQQAFGYTKDVIDIPKMKSVWESFNWNVHEVDGHNLPELVETMSELNYSDGGPHVILANTICGKGVSFMERQIKWHYKPLSEAELQQALQEVNQNP